MQQRGKESLGQHTSPRPAACRGGPARGASVRAAARKDRRIHEEMDWGRGRVRKERPQDAS